MCVYLECCSPHLSVCLSQPCQLRMISVLSSEGAYHTTTSFLLVCIHTHTHTHRLSFLSNVSCLSTHIYPCRSLLVRRVHIPCGAALSGLYNTASPSVLCSTPSQCSTPSLCSTPSQESYLRTVLLHLCGNTSGTDSICLHGCHICIAVCIIQLLWGEE